MALPQSTLCMKLEGFVLCPEGFPGNVVWCGTLFGKNTPVQVSRCVFHASSPNTENTSETTVALYFERKKAENLEQSYLKTK